MMTRKIQLAMLIIGLITSIPMAQVWARGGMGGGARGGGGAARMGGGGGGARMPSGGGGGARMPSGGGFSGGNFGGGGGFNGGGFSGGVPRTGSGFNNAGAAMRPSGGMSGFNSGAGRSPIATEGFPNRGAGVSGNNPPATNLAGGSRGAAAGAAGVAGTRQANLGGERGLAGGDRFSAPSNNELSNFLGLPSDQGLHSLSTRTGASQLPADNLFDVNRGTAEGPRGGQAAGISVTGPNDNTVGKAVGVGPNGGVASVGGVKGSEGGGAARGVAVGPDGRVAAGRVAVGPNGGAAAGGVVAGPAGVAGGFARVSPSGRYVTAAAVRTNYNYGGIYGAGWYTDHPGAWFAAGWAANAAWQACTWSTAAYYCGYDQIPPVYYDYGNNVTYQNNVVTVNGEEVGTAEEYYDQAATLASTGAKADAPADGQWLPLGVFALTKPDQTNAVVSIQLAVNKDGVIRGNYSDTKTGTTQQIQGSVDKETQRVAFTVGDNSSHLIETGLYNLTKDESPCLLHFGNEKTEQWLLVRLKDPQGESEN